jgi:eukaryotic-like serine/threonine-protein kinase
VKPSYAVRQAAAAGEDVARPRSARPEALSKRLEGDLDNIVMKAMRKEPQRRYATAEQLAEDLRRHRRGLPVIARPDTFGYRTGKWIRRNKPAVVIAVLLVAFAVGMIVQSIRVRRERDVAEAALASAEREATRAGKVSSFLEELFRISDPSESRGRQVTARELLEKGAQSIAQELSDQPEVQATLMHTMGSAYMGLGLYADAQKLFEQSLAIRRRVFGDVDHADLAESLNSMGSILFYRRQYDAAAERHREALEMRRRLYGEEHAAVAQSLHGLALATFNTGDHEGAERYFRQALEIRRRLPEPAIPDLLESLKRLAQVAKSRGEAEEEERLLREALDRGQGIEHPTMAADSRRCSSTGESSTEPKP